jgi:uncharacterized UBP type Zn finger protein
MQLDPLRQEDHKANSCEHLEGLSAKDFPPQKTPGACEECLTEGTVWVALRECQSCGHVGCCDSSTGQHATKHFHQTQYPVMRTVPPALGYGAMSMRHRVCSVNDSSSAAGIELFVAGGMAQISTRR